MSEFFELAVIDVDKEFNSVFTTQRYEQNKVGGMLLTDRVNAENLRLRRSDEGYLSDWHVAGDPTMIVVQQGMIEIALRNGDTKRFGVGDSFIAQDYLPQEVAFDDSKHGHRAKVIGKECFQAIHIKLNFRDSFYK